MKHLYKYPQAEFPYADLVNKNRSRSKSEQEYELLDTGIFNNNEYFDVFTEYAKNEAEDLLIRITVHNRADKDAIIAVLPTLWMRNLWSFGLMNDKPMITLKEGGDGYGHAKVDHPQVGPACIYILKNRSVPYLPKTRPTRNGFMASLVKRLL